MSALRMREWRSGVRVHVRVKMGVIVTVIMTQWQICKSVSRTPTDVAM
jgi:hypothetical protein